jgi:hypothetical protein
VKKAVRLFQAHHGRPQTTLHHHGDATRHKNKVLIISFVNAKKSALCSSSLKTALRHIRETLHGLHGQMCCFRG